MAKINILNKQTIDKIAAGEVVERPLNVVKEIVENAIDAEAGAITVEIKEGGVSFIRVTDDGTGIDYSEITKVFMPHATSKIQDADDLLSISSLGFRGEALSSISAVSEVEVISKTRDSLTGFHYICEGGTETLNEQIGAPDGTTFIVRNLFYNVPARKKFLKSNVTEGSYIADLMEHIALSHPEISIKFINNNKIVFATSGNGDLKEVIYRIYGKDIAAKLLLLNYTDEFVSISGYLGKPEINRSNRSNETFFINGRYINSSILSKAVEEGYSNYLMMHKFPFCVLHFNINPSQIDVNVHPSKMEIRLQNQEIIYNAIKLSVSDRLAEKELIPEVFIDRQIVSAPVLVKNVPEPFEQKRINIFKASEPLTQERSFISEKSNIIKAQETIVTTDIAQMNLFDDNFLSKESKDKYEILGQIFKTYWLIAFEDKLYMMDQHAAHEKVKYERIMSKLSKKSVSSQVVNPPVIVELTSKENEIVNSYLSVFNDLGFEIEDFGLGSVALRAVPVDLYGCNELELFKEILDELIENPLKEELSVVHYKIASMACKAAVKGNMEMTKDEVSALLDELLTLENPYNCPHGRPTIVSMSRYEIEKKFKRIVN